MWCASSFVVARERFSALLTYWRPRWVPTAARKLCVVEAGCRRSRGPASHRSGSWSRRVRAPGLTDSVFHASPASLPRGTFDLPGPWVETLCLLPFEAGFSPTRRPGKPPNVDTSLWHVGSSSLARHRAQGPLLWEPGVSTTGPPGRSLPRI